MRKHFVHFYCTVHAFYAFPKHATVAPGIHCTGFQTNHILGADHFQFTRRSNLKDFIRRLIHWVDEDGIVFLAELGQVNCCEEIKIKVLPKNLSFCSDSNLTYHLIDFHFSAFIRKSKISQHHHKILVSTLAEMVES